MHPGEVVDHAQHRVDRLVEVEVTAAGQNIVDERPVQDAELRVEDPEEADRAQCDRSSPRQQDQEADEPASAKGPNQRVREDCSTYDDKRLGDEREYDCVLERGAEVRVVPGVDEVVEADPAAGERAGSCVGEAEIDGEAERDPDEQGDEDHRWRYQRGGEETALFEKVSRAPPFQFPPGDGFQAARIVQEATVSG